MLAARQSAGILLLATWTIGFPGCSCDGSNAGADAGLADGGIGRSDAGVGQDGAAPLIWIDFSISGCAEDFEPGPDSADAGPAADAGATEPCVGPAPLALSFVPVAPAAVDIYEWQFGDGSENQAEAAPLHVYELAGSYSVSLSAQGPGGTAVVSKPSVVRVGPAALGGPCVGDEGCLSGTCICGEEPCDALQRGFCTESCSEESVCSSGVCADLAASDPGAPSAWQAELCLAECESGADCALDQVCLDVPAADVDGWVRACFAPGVLAGIGDSCADGDGDLQDQACASGLCLAEGQRGLCSADCGDIACPEGSACATFNGGPAGPFCLARCDSDSACDGDPWLACQAPGGPGNRGFVVDEVASPDGYCARKTCADPDECGDTGTCQNGFCTAP